MLLHILGRKVNPINTAFSTAFNNVGVTRLLADVSKIIHGYRVRWYDCRRISNFFWDASVIALNPISTAINFGRKEAYYRETENFFCGERHLTLSFKFLNNISQPSSRSVILAPLSWHRASGLYRKRNCKDAWQVTRIANPVSFWSMIQSLIRETQKR